MPTAPLTFLIIPAEGSPSLLTAADGNTAAYEAVRAAIGGGWVEQIRVNGPVLLVDEDGKRKQMPFNRTATELALDNMWLGDYVGGTVVLAGPEDADGAWTSIDPAYVRAHLHIEMPT
jgi:hypothetical protein